MKQKTILLPLLTVSLFISHSAYAQTIVNPDPTTDICVFGKQADGITDDSTSVQCGNSQSKGQNSISIGDGAYADSVNIHGNSGSATAIGFRATAQGAGSMAIGDSAYAESDATAGALAVGRAAQAITGSASAYGGGSKASSRNSTAVGSSAQATNNAATALGSGANAQGENSTAVGVVATAYSDGATALGNNAQAQGESSTAVGSGSYTTQNYGTAVGVGANTQGASATATGFGASASGNIAVASGSFSIASGNGSATYGANSTATATASTALGVNTTATGRNCVALGSSSECDATNELSVGNTNLNRRITNASAGINANDAVIMEQLDYVIKSFDPNAGFSGGVYTAPRYEFISGKVYTTVAGGFADLDSRVWNLENNPNTGSGTPGKDGKSAYEVAIDNGFTGTQQEWLTSLEGKPGQDGKDSTVAGPAGKDGVDGEDSTVPGPAGPTGPAGSDGADGKDAVNGSGTDELAVHYDDADKNTATLRSSTNGTTRLSGVANGRIEQGSTDAVNGGQIWELNDRWEQRYKETNRNIEKLGAQSAALSMMASSASYLPVGKVAIQSGVGMYGSEAAVAVGFKVRTSEKSSLSGGFSFANGKAMGGFGYSYTLD